MLNGPFSSPFKKGERVLVAYDGKGGRCTAGKILRMRGCAILVRFIPWGTPEDGSIDEWFMPIESNSEYGSNTPCTQSSRSYGKFVKPKRGQGLMTKLFGVSGDWYSVYKWNKDCIKRSKRNSSTKNVCDTLKAAL